MQVFDDLHVVRGNDDADIAEGLHLSALETGNAKSCGPCLARHSQGIQYILGISTSTDGERNILCLHEISQLLCENILIAEIVSPCCEGREIVGQGDYTKPLSAIAISGTFAEVA